MPTGGLRKNSAREARKKILGGARKKPSGENRKKPSVGAGKNPSGGAKKKLFGNEYYISAIVVNKYLTQFLFLCISSNNI